MTSNADESAYRAAFRSMRTPALLTDTEFVITDVNDAGRSFVGYEHEELVGSHVSMLAGDDGVIDEIVADLLDGDVWRGQFPLRRSDGDDVFGRGSASPYVVDGEVRGYVAVFVDVTDRYRYERTTRVLNRLLRHDLRNEVNVAVANLQTARSAVDDPDAIDALDRASATLTDIVEKSQRARDLQEILERDYEGAAHTHMLDDVVHDALADVIEEYGDAEFEVPDLPSIHIVGDNLLSTVFHVILENAVDHNDAADPRVEVTVDRLDEECVVVGVSDNGPGIPDGAEDLVFGREEQDPLHHGSGISLFFADAAVDSYGGSVWIDSGDESGTTVKVELPRAVRGTDGN